MNVENGKTQFSPADQICLICGTVGSAEIKRKGSGVLEFFLYCCAIFPGVFYSYWRSANKSPVCKACGKKEMIPVGTPAGRELVARVNPTASIYESVQPTLADQGTPAMRPAFHWVLLVIILFVGFVVASGHR